MQPAVHNRVRHHRERAGMSQQALADRVGVSRQAVNAVESGRTVPSTTLALQLARALGCRVDALFGLADEGLPVVLGAGAGSDRVALAEVDGRWVAHRLAPDARIGADGVLEDGRVRPLVDLDALRDRVLVAGCAPLLGALVDRVTARGGPCRPRWIHAGSGRALDLLEAGQVHVAGIHLSGDVETHVDAVRARFPGRRMQVVHLTRWRQGLVIAAGNPLGIGPGALARPGLRFASREEGAGAQRLAARLLREEGVMTGPPAGPVANGHVEVAERVKWGAADVGIAIESVASAAGLAFVPLTEERFDLVLPASSMGDPRIRALLDGLVDAGFRREVAEIDGYDATDVGSTTTIEAHP
ncbi:MAG: substrate-binding domain-containing protein [Myxococcota bacterium]